MKMRTLGGSLTVSGIGIGCLPMSSHYGTADDAESMATVNLAIDLGVNLFDTADAYGHGHNEEFVGRALRGRRHEIKLSTKFGQRDDGDRKFDGRPEYVKSACEASLKRLGVESIDLYYIHRLDLEVPIEETIGAMVELLHAGKIRAIGLSEMKPENIRRAHAVHPVTALQSEWSLFCRDPEMTGSYEICRELGIGFVAYAPLGRGILTGKVQRAEDMQPGDRRLKDPRFYAENFDANLKQIERVKALASEWNMTPGQLALAWLLARGDDVIAIPGMERRAYLEENVAACAIVLTPIQLAAIDAAVPKGSFAGDRHTNMSNVNR